MAGCSVATQVEVRLAGHIYDPIGHAHHLGKMSQDRLPGRDGVDAREQTLNLRDATAEYVGHNLTDLGLL